MVATHVSPLTLQDTITNRKHKTMKRRRRSCLTNKYTPQEKQNISLAHTLLNSSRKNYTSIGRKVQPFFAHPTNSSTTSLRKIGKDTVRLCTNLHTLMHATDHTHVHSPSSKKPYHAHQKTKYVSFSQVGGGTSPNHHNGSTSQCRTNMIQFIQNI